MNWWLLLGWLLCVWFIVAMEAAFQNAIKDARNPLPDGQRTRSGLVIHYKAEYMAGALICFGIAKLIDVAAAPWGIPTYLVAACHLRRLALDCNRPCRAGASQKSLHWHAF